MKISRIGYCRCPSCLCHVKVAQDADCPFCGAEIEAAPVIGAGAMEKLRSSRSALIAMGLAGGFTFAVACSGSDPDPKPNNTTEPNIDPGNDYGGFDPNTNNTTTVTENPDAGTDSGSPDAGGDAGGTDAGDPDMG